jgi:hypothetical protein
MHSYSQIESIRININGNHLGSDGCPHFKERINHLKWAPECGGEIKSSGTWKQVQCGQLSICVGHLAAEVSPLPDEAPNEGSV